MSKRKEHPALGVESQLTDDEGLWYVEVCMLPCVAVVGRNIYLCCGGVVAVERATSERHQRSQRVAHGDEIAYAHYLLGSTGSGGQRLIRRRDIVPNKRVAAWLFGAYGSAPKLNARFIETL